MESPDSAFFSSSLELPTGAQAAAGAEPLMSAPVSMISDIAIMLSILLCLFFFRRIAGVLPSVIGCLVRWKECLNLEDSMKLARDRNILAVILALPFVATVSDLGFFRPDFASGWSSAGLFGLTAGYLAVHLALRLTAQGFIRPQKIAHGIYSATGKMFFSFFIIEAISVFAIAGICAFADIPKDTAHDIALYCTAAVFLMFLARKTQIFGKYCSYLTAFLYLCALEILPAGIVVAAAIFL